MKIVAAFGLVLLSHGAFCHDLHYTTEELTKELSKRTLFYDSSIRIQHVSTRYLSSHQPQQQRSEIHSRQPPILSHLSRQI